MSDKLERIRKETLPETEENLSQDSRHSNLARVEHELALPLHQTARLKLT
jgi:hypothetical protein